MMTVGIVGLGKMGSAIARNLLSHGYAVSVWNRSPQAIDALVAEGAKSAASLPALLEAVDVAIVMLWGDEVARAVSLAQVIPAARAGQLIIEMSTLSPSMYATLEHAATERGVAFLAAPVLGSVDVARRGALTVLAGGDRATFERARELLGTVGSTLMYTGSVQASGYLKLANNTILGVFAETIGELLALCELAGVDRRVAVELLAGTFGRAAASKAEQLAARDDAPRFSLGALLKDLELAHASAQPLHLSTPVMDVVLSEFRSAAAAGLAERDYIAAALQRETAGTASAVQN